MDPDDEDLIPPTLSITLPPITLSSRPPTKEDVDRAEYLMNMVQATLSAPMALKASREDLDNTHNYYLRVCEKYEQDAGLAGHTVTDVLVAIRNEMRAMREGSDRQFRDLGGQVRDLGGQVRDLGGQVRDLGGQVRDLKHQSTMQLELTNRLVQSMFGVRSEVIQPLRQQVIARNRELTESGQPAMEVVFLDGSTPSSHGLAPLRYYQDIQALNSNQARQYARGHGFGGTVGEIKDRLGRELGVVQATE
ncbi:hypothetical protein V1527DRAFT_522598 [Lipomyces starkeyi]